LKKCAANAKLHTESSFLINFLLNLISVSDLRFSQWWR
jgi:hypothetical protein